MAEAPDMSLAIDHIFVFVQHNTTLNALTESYRRAHPGQGTANVCYCFDNAYLELLWAVNDDELRTIPRTGLFERSRWRDNGASPFGIALRSNGPDRRLPFPCWDYAPSYLPPGLTIPMATSSADPRQPLIFLSPGSQPPSAWTDGRAGQRQRATGLTDISGLRVGLPSDAPPCEALLFLATAGLLSIEPTDRHTLTLTLSTEHGSCRSLALPELVFAEG